jgi:hypothetical protein
MCGFNLSYESLTSFATRQVLHQLRNTDLTFWKELDEGRQCALTVDLQVAVLEDKLTAEGGTTVDDDTAMHNKNVVVKLISGKRAAGEAAGKSNKMVAYGEAELTDFNGGKEIVGMVKEELGCGKRRRKANALYSHSFWLNHGDD